MNQRSTHFSGGVPSLLAVFCGVEVNSEASGQRPTASFAAAAPEYS